MEPDTVLREEAARIFEIGAERRAVSLSGHEIVVAGGEAEAERIPLEAIAGLVAYRPGPSWAAPALAALTERGAGIVLCGPNHDSHCLAWPVPNRRWPARIRAQLDLYPPYARHLLRQLERARDAQRILALETMGAGRRMQALKAAPRPLRHLDRSALERARQRLSDERSRVVRSDELEAVTGLSRYELARQFRALYGTSPYRYLLMRRLADARKRVARSEPLAEIAVAVGFSDQAHLTRMFKAAYGQTPARFRSLLR